MSETSPKNSLLGMPREVRNKIYAEMFPKCEVTVCDTPEAHISLESFEPGISRTCNLLRTECLEVFYSTTVFLFWIPGWHDSCVLRKWCKLVPSDLLKRVSRIKFNMKSNSGWNTATDLLQLIEEKFAPDCFYRFCGEALGMCCAYEKSCDMGQKLRMLGATWEQVEEQLENFGEALFATMFGGVWQTDFGVCAGDEEGSDDDDELDDDDDASYEDDGEIDTDMPNLVANEGSAVSP